MKYGHHSLVYTDFSKNAQAIFLRYLEYKHPGNTNDAACTLWTTKATTRDRSEILLTSMLPLDPENILLGYCE